MDFAAADGSRLTSHAASTVNAPDNTSTLDLDDGILDARLRRHHDEDEGSGLEEDDLESMTSAPTGGKPKEQSKAEEEKELPPYACA